MSPADSPRAAIVLFEGFELLDATGPYEVLAAPRGPGEPPAFEILSCAARPGLIASAAGLVCQASSKLADATSADLRVSILNYLLDTGQMRVSAEGRWLSPGRLVVPPKVR